jgi:hypothetical protein
LIFLENRREDVQESPCPFAQLHLIGLGLAVLQAVAAALELAQEGSEQLGKVIDLLQLDDPVIDGVNGRGFRVTCGASFSARLVSRRPSCRS